MTIDYVKQSQDLVAKIQEAEKLGQPIVDLAKKHIEVLTAHYDEFVRRADEANIHNIERASYEIKYLSNIKAWANKIGLPVDKYDKAIKDIRVKFLGEAESLIKFIPKK